MRIAVMAMVIAMAVSMAAAEKYQCSPSYKLQLNVVFNSPGLLSGLSLSDLDGLFTISNQCSQAILRKHANVHVPLAKLPSSELSEVVEYSLVGQKILVEELKRGSCSTNASERRKI